MTGTEIKPSFPTTTAHTTRLVLFQATRRPQPINGETITTPWGKIRLWARLGQQHADVLEAICYAREKTKVLEDGAIKLLVDPARVRRLSRQDGSTLQQILLDLQQAVIEIIEPRNLACQGQIVGHIDKAMRRDGTPITRPDPLSKSERALWSVTLGPVLSRLVQADIWLGYNPAPIARLRHGISQAVTRHVLSHKTQPAGGWKIDTLITSVIGGAINAKAMRDRRLELRKDAAALAELGIALDGDRIFKR